MKLTVDEIKERVKRADKARAGYRERAKVWQDAWELKTGDTRTIKEAIEIDGQEKVTLPTPFTVVQLAQRLIASEPRIDVPSSGDGDGDVEADQVAEKKERWLSAVWQHVNRHEEVNVITALTIYSLVRGRHAMEVKWIGNLPGYKERGKQKQGKRCFPISVRALDPLNVFVQKGRHGTQWAFHRYRCLVMDVKQQYMGVKRFRAAALEAKPRKDDAEVEMVDFWWMGDGGAVWNAVLVDGEFVIEPRAMDYAFIPLIEGLADVGITMDGSYDGIGLLHSIVDLWKYENRLISQIGTALLWYFWPPILIENDQGYAVDQIKIGPGQTTAVPAGTRVNMPQVNPNVPLAQSVHSLISGAQQQSTFPSVMYGQAPGDLTAGYGVSLLAQAAKGRIKTIIENLERTLATACEHLLGLVDVFADSEGVEVWGKDSVAGKKYRLALTAGDVNGYYENTVTLTPQVPADDMQKMTMGMRMIETGVLSPESYLDKFVSVPLPADELNRALLFKVLNSPEVFPVTAVQLLKEKYPDNWVNLVRMSPKLMEAAVGLGLGHRMPDGSLMAGPASPGMGMRPGLSPGMSMQPPGMNYEGGGIPPEVQGQMKPQNVGMAPGDQSGMFEMLMGGGRGLGTGDRRPETGDRQGGY